MPHKDPKALKAYHKKYWQRPEVKERDRKRNRKAYLKAYHKKYRERPEVKEKRRKYHQQPEVRERKRKYQKAYQSQPEVKEKKRKYKQLYDQRPEVKKRALHFRKHDPNFKRRKHLREKVNLAVIHQTKYTSTIHKLIGCDVATARAHLESQFKDWMNWDNYGRGRGKWCIDHIVAVATIDIFNEDEVKRIFHYTNMQPLEFCKNCEKGVN